MKLRDDSAAAALREHDNSCGSGLGAKRAGHDKSLGGQGGQADEMAEAVIK